MSSPYEDPADRATKYINALAKAVKELSPLNEDATVKATNLARVTDAIRRYREDAEFYLKAGKPVTSLASIAYAEGLLDALKFLQLAKMKPAR